MRAIVRGEPAVLRRRPNVGSEMLARIPAGEELDVDGWVKEGRPRWLLARRSDGTLGHLTSDTDLHLIERFATRGQAAIHAEPSLDSAVLHRLEGGDQFDVLGYVQGTEEAWLHVRNRAGARGYLAERTRRSAVAQPTRRTALREIAIGAAWAIGAPIAMFGSYEAMSAAVTLDWRGLRFLVGGFGVMGLIGGTLIVTAGIFNLVRARI